jgi:hypothetical protein
VGHPSTPRDTFRHLSTPLQNNRTTKEIHKTDDIPFNLEGEKNRASKEQMGIEVTLDDTAIFRIRTPPPEPDITIATNIEVILAEEEKTEQAEEDETSYDASLEDEGEDEDEDDGNSVASRQDDISCQLQQEQLTDEGDVEEETKEDFFVISVTEECLPPPQYEQPSKHLCQQAIPAPDIRNGECDDGDTDISLASLQGSIVIHVQPQQTQLESEEETKGDPAPNMGNAEGENDTFSAWLHQNVVTAEQPQPTQLESEEETKEDSASYVKNDGGDEEENDGCSFSLQENVVTPERPQQKPLEVEEETKENRTPSVRLFEDDAEENDSCLGWLDENGVTPDPPQNTQLEHDDEETKEDGTVDSLEEFIFSMQQQHQQMQQELERQQQLQQLQQLQQQEWQQDERDMPESRFDVREDQDFEEAREDQEELKTDRIWSEAINELPEEKFGSSNQAQEQRQQQRHTPQQVQPQEQQGLFTSEIETPPGMEGVLQFLHAIQFSEDQFFGDEDKNDSYKSEMDEKSVFSEEAYELVTEAEEVVLAAFIENQKRGKEAEQKQATNKTSVKFASTIAERVKMFELINNTTRGGRTQSLSYSGHAPNGALLAGKYTGETIVPVSVDAMKHAVKDHKKGAAASIQTKFMALTIGDVEAGAPTEHYISSHAAKHMTSSEINTTTLADHVTVACCSGQKANHLVRVEEEKEKDADNPTPPPELANILEDLGASAFSRRYSRRLMKKHVSFAGIHPNTTSLSSGVKRLAPEEKEEEAGGPAAATVVTSTSMMDPARILLDLAAPNSASICCGGFSRRPMVSNQRGTMEMDMQKLPALIDDCSTLIHDDESLSDVLG